MTIEAPAIEARRLEIAATQTMSASADGRNEIQPASAGFVCVDAVSTAWFLLIIEARRLEIAATQTMSAYADGRKKVQPASAGFVCVDAVSTAGFLQPMNVGFVEIGIK